MSLLFGISFRSCLSHLITACKLHLDKSQPVYPALQAHPSFTTLPILLSFTNVMTFTTVTVVSCHHATELIFLPKHETWLYFENELYQSPEAGPLRFHSRTYTIDRQLVLLQKEITVM